MFNISESRDLIDLISIVTGVLGCATGCISLWMQLVNKPKVKLKKYAPQLIGFMDNSYCDEKRFKTPGKIALVPISIISKKPLDTSIYHIDMIYNGTCTTYDSQYKVSKIVDSEISVISSQLTNSNGQIVLPYRLHGMETVNPLLTFPYVQSMYEEYIMTGEPIKAVVRIHTSTKILEYPVLLKDIKSNITNLTC